MDDKEFGAAIDAVLDIAKELGRMPENIGPTLMVARMLHEINKTLKTMADKDKMLDKIGKEYCKKYFELVEDKI